MSTQPSPAATTSSQPLQAEVASLDSAVEPAPQAGGCCRSRRAVLGGTVLGAAALSLAACAPAAAPKEAPQATGAGKAVLKLSDLAVGAQASAKLGKEELILFRPDEKTVLAYSAICTHAGCVVLPAENQTFHCPCHDSTFNAADGSVAGGPAPKALPRYAAEISGEDILVFS